MIKETACGIFCFTTSQVILNTFFNEWSCDQQASHLRRGVSSSAYSRVRARRARGSLVHQEPLCNSTASCPAPSLCSSQQSAQPGFTCVTAAGDTSSGCCCQSGASQASKAKYRAPSSTANNPSSFILSSRRLLANCSPTFIPRYENNIMSEKHGELMEL